MKLKASHAWLFSAFLAGANATSSEAQQASSPEHLVQEAQMQLNLIEQQAKSVGSLSSAAAFAPYQEALKHSLERAQHYLDLGEFHAAAAEAKDYLQLLQKPEGRTYLQALTILGRAQEGMGASEEAILSFRRYIASFISQQDKNYSEMTETLNRLLPLAVASNAYDAQELKRLLAGVLSLPMNEGLSAEILYLAARSAAERGNYSLAANWFEDAAKRAPDSHLKARSLYFRAVIHLRDKQLDQARMAFAEAAQQKEPGAADFRNLALLGLARIAVMKREPEKALAYYSDVSAGNPAIRKAAFESIYVLLELGKEAQASEAATRFIAEQPNSEESLTLKNLLAYLQMRSGDWNSAIASIESRESEISTVTKQVTTRYHGRDRLTHTDLKNLQRTISPFFKSSTIVDQGMRAFDRLEQLMYRLAQIQGNVSDFTYVLGRLESHHLRPHWAMKAEQLAELSEHVLEQGKSLVAAESKFYESAISETDALRLKSLMQKRHRLVGSALTERRLYRGWQSWLNYAQLENRLVALSEKVRDAHMTARGTDYISRATNSGELGNQASNVEEQSTQALASYETTQRLREVLRKEKLRGVASRSRARTIKDTLVAYAVVLQDEAVILATYRDKLQEPAARAFAREAATAWKRWDHVTKLTFTKLVDLAGEIDLEVRTILAAIEEQSSKQMALAREVQHIKGRLELTMGHGSEALLSEFQHEAESQQAKHRKWRADLNWLQYEKSKDQLQEQNLKTATQYQILRDNLDSLRQGALWR